MKTVHVAAGIIRRPDASNEVLAVQRGYGDMAGLWEFPGGKLERNESAADACRRELQEELGIHVDNLRSFYTVEYDYPDFHLSMECFFCQILTDENPSPSSQPLEPQANDGQRAMRWIPLDRLGELAWMPADIELIEALSRVDEDAGTADDGKASSTASGKTRGKKDLLAGIDTSDLSASETNLVRRRAAIRRSMQGNKRSDTKPEMLVRQRLREAGLTGYRLQWKKAPGRPDIAFPGRKVAIFVNGCFWHRCPHCKPSMPKRNVEFWEAKFRRNVERDTAAIQRLEELGWMPVTIWECELKRDRIDATMERVIEVVRAAGH